MQSNCASFCLLCAFVAKLFIGLAKVKTWSIAEKPKKTWNGKALGLGVLLFVRSNVQPHVGEYTLMFRLCAWKENLTHAWKIAMLGKKKITNN
jgi:hypothetical protein